MQEKYSNAILYIFISKSNPIEVNRICFLVTASRIITVLFQRRAYISNFSSKQKAITHMAGSQQLHIDQCTLQNCIEQNLTRLKNLIKSQNGILGLEMKVLSTIFQMSNHQGVWSLASSQKAKIQEASRKQGYQLALLIGEFKFSSEQIWDSKLSQSFLGLHIAWSLPEKLTFLLLVQSYWS